MTYCWYILYVVVSIFIDKGYRFNGSFKVRSLKLILFLLLLYLMFYLCSIRKWTGSNKLNSILVKVFPDFHDLGLALPIELALWSIIWLTVCSLICWNNIFVALDAFTVFKVPPCIYIDMHLKAIVKNTPKTLPKSTKWNNILIRLEHASLSPLTTRAPP